MSEENYSYIKVDTTGFEEKIKKAWQYYREDIEYWTESYKAILDKYYGNNTPKKLEINSDNKNIKKMVELFNKKVLDPFNMFMFINSVNEPFRNDIVNQLTDKIQTKNYNFLGVPHYGQTPAITKEFNKSDIDYNINDDENLRTLANVVKVIENIDTYNNNDLQENLKSVCELYCKNGIAKLTSALYYINPDNFIPVNKYTAELFDLPTKYSDKNEFIQKYIDLCKAIKKDEKELREQTDFDKIKLFPLISSYAFYSKNVVAEILNNYSQTKNIILTGAPGTGKTYSIKSYLQSKLGNDYTDKVCFMQFHPNIDYSDFIEGIKPAGVKDGILNIKLQNGIFKEFCKKAFKNPKEKYYFVIDEINRANLSVVFGEILNALEYRIKFNSNTISNPHDFIDTQYTNVIEKLDKDDEKKKLSVHEDYIGKFGIPDNLYLLATMNDVDKSIDSFDLALRRRFVWIEMGFDENILRFEIQNEPEKIIKKAKELNKILIEILGSKSYEIGHAYFLHILKYADDENSYESLWNYHLEPLIKEYLRANISPDEIEKHINDLKNTFIK